MKVNHGAVSKIGLYHVYYHRAGIFMLLVLPFLFTWFLSIYTHIPPALLFEDVGKSFVRMTIAFLIAATLGWIGGVVFYRGKRSKIFLPIFDVLQSFPTFAALPLVVYFWGPSNFTVIFFLVLTIIWPIFFSIISNLKLVKEEWYEAATIYHLRGFRYLKKFLIPISIPGLITGTIVGLGEGWEALVATEIITNVHTGLGEFFQQFSTDVRATTLGIVGFLLLIFIINKLLWLPLLERSHRLLEE